MKRGTSGPKISPEKFREQLPAAPPQEFPDMPVRSVLESGTSAGSEVTP